MTDEIIIDDAIRVGKKNRFRTGFTFTGNFYYEKLKEIFKIRHRFFYKNNKPHTFRD